MKRVMLACIGVISMVLAQAQPPQPGGPPPPHKGERIQKRVDHMTTQYGLNEQQKTQVTDLLKNMAGQLKQIRDKYKDDRKAAAPEVKALRQEYHKQLKGILTPEQYEKWKADAKARHQEMKKKREARQNGQAPPPPPAGGDPLNDFDVLGD